MLFPYFKFQSRNSRPYRAEKRGEMGKGRDGGEDGEGGRSNPYMQIRDSHAAAFDSPSRSYYHIY